MISSWMKHSRSAQRRPWRSFSSTSWAIARDRMNSAFSNRARGNELGLQQLGEVGAENILVPGVFCGQRVDRGGDPRRVETLVGLGAGLCHNAVHEVFGYRTARALSRIIVGWQQGRPAFHPVWAIAFSQPPFPGTYFLIDASN